MNCGHTVGTHESESGNKSAGWLVPALRLWERGSEGTWTGEPGWWKLCGRVRGIALKLRFIWIGLFIAVVSKYLSTRLRPEVRSLFPPCPSSKSLSLRLSPHYTTRPWTGPASTISAYDSNLSRPGCVVLGVCLSVVCLFLFYFPFSIFFCGHGMGSLTRWLAGSRSTANRPTAHRSTTRHRQSP